MNNSQQQERFKQLQDFLKQIGFTGNVPFTLRYSSLSSEEKKKFINETNAVFAHILNIAPNELPELLRLLNIDEDASNDENIQFLSGH
jgi:coenzyme F420-reducing hydrogenase delta subunit